MVNLELRRGLIAIDFYKVNGTEILSDEKYELVSVEDDQGLGLYSSVGEFAQLSIRRFESRGSSVSDNPDNFDFLKLIPDAIIEELSNVSTKDDLTKYQNYNEYIIYKDSPSNHVLSLRISIPFKVKQVTAKPGFIKDNIVFASQVLVQYSYDDNENITSADVNVVAVSRSEKVIYNMNAMPINSLGDLTKYQFKSVEDACFNSEGGRIVTDVQCTNPESYYSVDLIYVPYFESKEGTVTFKIDNTVNGLVKYNASKNKNLKYIVNVTNTGNASSSENVITTYIPKEIIVDKKSISNNGIYNKNDHTITWNVDLIDVLESLSFSYEATAPNDVNGKDLIGNSSIKSAQVTKTVYSNDTIVTLDKVIEIIDNPKTGTMIYIANTNIGLSLTHLIMFLVILAIIIVFLIRKILKIKKISN